MVLKNFGTDVINLAKNYNTLNIMSDKQAVSVERLVKRLNSLKDTGNLTTKSITGLYKSVESLNSDNLTYYFQSVAEGAENARVNIVDAYAAILDGNTHGLKNVQSIFNTYNNTLKNSEKDQKAFTKAVGQTNTSLSNYLSTVKTDGSASLTGYMGYLAKTTAKTIGLQAATLALNTALTMGISFGISLLAKAVNDFINAEQEAIDKARESIENNKNQIKSLEETKQKYLEIIDSEKTYVEKTKEINKWKETLIETYGFEKDALEKVNSERKTGIDLINEEINRSRNLWLGENASQSQIAKSKIETNLFSNFTIQNSSVETKELKENIRQNILDIFDYAKQEWDASNAFLNYDEQIVLGFNVDNIYDTKNKIEEALTSLGEIGYDNLSYQEKELSKQLNSYKEKIDKIIEDYGDIYTTFNEYTAQNLFAQFISQTGNQISLVTESNFEIWKNSLLEMAGESKPLQEALQKIINETFPQFSQESKKISPSIDSITRSTYNFVEVTEDLQKSLDDTFSNQSTLQSAFDKIQKGSSLSADEVRKLLELCKDSYPEIATSFTKTADGYTISANDIISANEAITKSTKEELQNQINEYQNIVDAYNDKKLSPPTINSHIDYQNYSSELSNLAIEADKAQSAIDVLSLVMEMFGLTTSDLDDNYKELMDNTSKLASKAKTLSSAFAEQNENGKLSVDTVLSLIENGYAAALMYDKKTGAIRLNAQAYIDLADAEISAQIAELTLAKSNDKASQEKLEVQRDIVSNLGWSYLGTAEAALRMAEAQEKLNNADADLSKYDAQIQALNDLRDNLGNIVNGTYGGSGSTEDLNKKAFEEANNLRKHWLAMGKDKTGKKYTEEMYYAWLDSADGYKNYFSDLTKYTDEYRQHEEEIYKWKKQQDQELFDRNIENIEKLAEKSLNGELPEEVDYTNPLDKFNVARQYYNEAITETQNRINELIESGSGDVQDEINTLKDSLKEFKDKLKDISDEEFEVKITTWENTNGYNDKDINSRTDRSNYVRTLIEEYYDLNSEEYEKYIGEIEEFDQETYKLKVENEKTYWESQLKAFNDASDEKIKKLQDEADEEERITKQKELQLNLIKAQQDLLNAKKNRNQLVFANGGFEYDYNQDDIISKMEAVADAEKDIADNIRDTQIEDSENEKESRSQWFKKLIDKIDEYLKMLNGEVTPTESDTSILNDVIKATDGKDSDIKTFTSFSQLLDKMGISYDKEAVNKLDNDSTASQQFFNNIAKTPNVPNLTPAVNYNNSTVNNNSKIDIGNMTINVPEGTTKEQVQSMIDQFGKGVLNAMRANKAKVQ